MIEPINPNEHKPVCINKTIKNNIEGFFDVFVDEKANRNRGVEIRRDEPRLPPLGTPRTSIIA